MFPGIFCILLTPSSFFVNTGDLLSFRSWMSEKLCGWRLPGGLFCVTKDGFVFFTFILVMILFTTETADLPPLFNWVTDFPNFWESACFSMFRINLGSLALELSVLRESLELFSSCGSGFILELDSVFTLEGF